MVKARNLREAKLAGGAALSALLLLAACGGSSAPPDLLRNAQAPCPNIGILSDAAELTRFRPGGGQDLTAMELNASLTGFDASCDYAPDRAGLDVTLTPRFTAERGPAATGRAAIIPYMVAVLDGPQHILSREAYNMQISFPGNVSRAQSQGEELSIRIPGTPQSAAQKNILIGFVLSPEELALNRRRGPR
ncbi:hypothetical protein [Teichococcus oryzae]|uniref:Uncharacterized protein n=1 Tax=Teichococcus oryzae TaxID=1608942 RepID=A0A5B2TKM3_9PROT|nr:hypothetical protein [Pseudoroseomonas oryzae]KAA2214458.1 hypothetical protein F0Q34_01665 [Pseudoroseomonas oryzae]